jgi:hypothetical protein
MPAPRSQSCPGQFAVPGSGRPRCRETLSDSQASLRSFWETFQCKRLFTLLLVTVQGSLLSRVAEDQVVACPLRAQESFHFISTLSLSPVDLEGIRT